MNKTWTSARTLTALLALGFAPIGCAKKTQDQPPAASKPAEGSAAPSASAPAANPTPAAEPAKPDPAAAKNVLDTAKQAGTFTTFLKAVDAAGLTDKLSGGGPFTVFAPTDDAFAKLPPKDLDALLADKAKLSALLEYHVVAGAVSSKDLAAAKTEKSVAGADLAIDAASGLKIAGATVVKPDLVASNGVIHAIDTVLTPPTK
ncbi:MAG TPA: fasciclin domain-containing protein [Kofleriaceae bacterium]|nr:fasciclin domain-containing protein [Kofleriaceae bacterium]